MINRTNSGWADIKPKLIPLFQTGVRLKKDVIMICLGVSKSKDNIHFFNRKSIRIINKTIAKNRI